MSHTFNLATFPKDVFWVSSIIVFNQCNYIRKIIAVSFHSAIVSWSSFRPKKGPGPDISGQQQSVKCKGWLLSLDTHVIRLQNRLRGHGQWRLLGGWWGQMEPAWRTEELWLAFLKSILETSLFPNSKSPQRWFNAPLCKESLIT